MRNINILTVLMFLFFFSGCKKDVKLEKKEIVVNDTESNYIVNDSFPIGDVRRYGIKIDGGDPIHPYTKISTFETVLTLAQNLGVELYFPKGYYREGLIIKGKENVKIKFDGAEFSGPIYIIEDENKKGSKKIELKGELITYTKFFTSYSSYIKIDKLHVKSDETLSNSKKRSFGADIYRGTRDLIIKELIIDDLGSGYEEFLTASAALQIHGWGANPKDIEINKVHIKSSDKHGAYITGDYIYIDELKIDAFGVGKQIFMTRMQDAAIGEERDITGLWINKCNNSSVESTTINTKNSEGKYSIWLDEGTIGEPTTIDEVVLIGGDKKLPIFADELTNCVIRKVVK